MSQAKKLTAKDWTLLTIASAKGDALSPVQLQKSLFLIGRNLSVSQRCGPRFYKFKPYDYGPFNSQIYLDAESLSSEGMIDVYSGVRAYREYAATRTGLARAKDLRSRLDPIARSYLDRVVAWTRGLSFGDLVRAIYSAYPEMRKNSVFRG